MTTETVELKNKSALCQKDSNNIFIDPVIAPSGNTYERSFIENYLETNKTDPITREPLTKDQLIPNRALKEIIEKKGHYYPVCPITQEIMKDPVITPSGQVYEKSAIELWLQTHNTDPINREPLTVVQLIPNQALKEYMSHPILPNSEGMTKLLDDNELDHNTAITLAIKSGRLDIIPTVCDHAKSNKINIDTDIINSAKEAAKQNNDGETTKYLEENFKPPEPPKNRWTNLHEEHLEKAITELSNTINAYSENDPIKSKNLIEAQKNLISMLKNLPINTHIEIVENLKKEHSNPLFQGLVFDALNEQIFAKTEANFNQARGSLQTSNADKNLREATELYRRYQEWSPKARLENFLNHKDYSKALELLRKHPDLVNAKLNLAFNINKHPDNNTPIKAFAVAGHLEGVKELLALGAKTRSAPNEIRFNTISTLISVLYSITGNNNQKPLSDARKIQYGDILAELIKNDPTLIQPHELNDVIKLGLIKSETLLNILPALQIPYRLNNAKQNYQEAVNKAFKNQYKTQSSENYMQSPDVKKRRGALINEQNKFYALLKDNDPHIHSVAEGVLDSLDPVTKLETYFNNKEYEKALLLLKDNPELINQKLILSEDINNHPNNNIPLNVFIAAGHLKGVQELLNLGAMPKKEHEGRGMGHVYEDPYDALSTMLDVLQNKALNTNEKINYGNIAAELFKKDPELLEGRAYINLNVAYDPNHKINMINRIESIGLTDNDELRKIISPLKYSEEIKKIDDAIKILDEEDPHEKDAGKQAKKTALTTVKTAMKTGEDISGKIAAAKNDPKVMQGIWKGGLGRSRTENLLNELEDSVKIKEPNLPSTSFRMG